MFLALGFAPLPCPHTGDFGELAINEWGGLVVDDGQMTNLPGVFAGGDLVRGPSLVLHAVRDARRAAAQIAAYLAARESKAHSPQSTVHSPQSTVHSPQSTVHSPQSIVRQAPSQS